MPTCPRPNEKAMVDRMDRMEQIRVKPGEAALSQVAERIRQPRIMMNFPPRPRGVKQITFIASSLYRRGGRCNFRAFDTALRLCSDCDGELLCSNTVSRCWLQRSF